MIENKELTKLIRGCKTSQDLHELQIAFANETIGRITDGQALRILEWQQKLYEKERNVKRSNEKVISRATS